MGNSWCCLNWRDLYYKILICDGWTKNTDLWWSSLSSSLDNCTQTVCKGYWRLASINGMDLIQVRVSVTGSRKQRDFWVCPEAGSGGACTSCTVLQHQFESFYFTLSLTYVQFLSLKNPSKLPCRCGLVCVTSVVQPILPEFLCICHSVQWSRPSTIMLESFSALLSWSVKSQSQVQNRNHQEQNLLSRYFGV